MQPPAIPGIPGGMPPGVPGGIPGGVPPMDFGDQPGMDRDGSELTAHEESREIHGHTCTRHTLTLGSSLELELWLAESPDLPPFYLLTWDGPPHFGHNDLLQDWPHLIRKAGKFPLLATLREAVRQDGFHDGIRCITGTITASRGIATGGAGIRAEIVSTSRGLSSGNHGIEATSSIRGSSETNQYGIRSTQANGCRSLSGENITHKYNMP